MVLCFVQSILELEGCDCFWHFHLQQKDQEISSPISKERLAKPFGH
jgi:hypothetical protein